MHISIIYTIDLQNKKPLYLENCMSCPDKGGTPFFWQPPVISPLQLPDFSDGKPHLMLSNTSVYFSCNARYLRIHMKRLMHFS